MILLDVDGHLVSDTSLKELHVFADKIGLLREWLQDHRWPHYDVWGIKRAEAVKAGAVLVDIRELLMRACK